MLSRLPAPLPSASGGDLYFGDNLALLRAEIRTASVDLVYLDPPFNSAKTYHLSRRRSKTEEQAFFDTWRWDDPAAAAYAEITSAESEAPPRLRALIRALYDVLGADERDTMAYLVMIAVRLVELRRVLRPTGSLYLHCDPTASHYLKLILDALFGVDCFRNEIIWRYRRWPTKARRFQRMHDVLLFYTARSDGAHTFAPLYGYETLAASTRKTFGSKRQRADFSSGHRKPGVEDAESHGPPLSDYWDIEALAESELPLSDAWEIGVIAPIGKERTGYPTQKPEKLLERIIRASSQPGDVVLDPFCGCGTTLTVAARENRRWIGIDAGSRAIELTKARLGAVLPAATWTVHGELGAADRSSLCPKPGIAKAGGALEGNPATLTAQR